MKVKVWLARDKDKYKETNLYPVEPEYDEEWYRWRCIGGGGAIMPKHYGLKPGEKKEATLVINEHNKIGMRDLDLDEAKALKEYYQRKCKKMIPADAKEERKEQEKKEQPCQNQP